MNKLILLFFLLTLICCQLTIAQSSKKEIINRNRQILALDTLQIKNGKHLDLAETFSVEKFIEYYVENGGKRNKKYGVLRIVELYKDSVYTYFGRKSVNNLFEFFKVLNNDLDGINYVALDGEALRDKFIAEIVPAKDKQHVKEKKCDTGFHSSIFSYKYLRESKEIAISYKWKISCDFVYKIINKVYKATYSLNSSSFSK